MTSSILSLILALTALAVSRDGDIRSVPLNKEFQIKAGEKVSLEKSSLTLSFTEVVEDSRCPENVKCIWAGNGKVALLISATGRRPGKVNLNTMLEPKQDSYGGYDVKLVKLDPYPKEGTAIGKGDYVATLLVTRKQSH